MSDQSFFAYLQSDDVNERVMAVTVLGEGLKDAAFLPDERQAIFRALTMVLDDPAVRVRKKLATILSSAESVPSHLLYSLVRDQFDVAEPLLAGCTAMHESDLVDMIGQGSNRVCEVIAMRAGLQASVAGAIAEVGNRESCARLLENDSARIAQVSLKRLAERFGDDAHIRAELIARDDLPPETRHMLLGKLSDALDTLIVSRKWLAPGRARAAVRDACEKATIEFAGAVQDTEQRALVAHLASVGQLTPGILMRALVIGNVGFVAEALSLLAGIPAKRAYRLLEDGHGAGQRALFIRAGLPERVHAGFSMALDCVIASRKEGFDFTSISDRRRLVERIMTRYEEYSGDELDYLFTLLMRLTSEAAREDARTYMASMGLATAAA